MTVHHVGARPPAGFQDANYFAQGGHAAPGPFMWSSLLCSYLHD
jgi:hypothetical protein